MNAPDHYRDLGQLPEARFKLIPAVYLLLRRGNEILLLKRANTGYWDGGYSLIAGHLDGDELGSEGLQREAKEEAGIIISKKDIQFVHLAHRLGRNEKGQERVDLFYEAWKWRGAIKNMEPEKCNGLTWFPIINLPKNTLPLIKRVINDVLSGVHYSEYKVEPLK
jgi:8-oxo-dGTP diphosphatase